MKLLLPLLGGAAAFFAGMWGWTPDSPAMLVVAAAVAAAVGDLWRDPGEPMFRRDHVQEQLEKLAGQVEPKLDIAASERIMREVTERPSEINPETLLSEVLKDEDRKWLKEQVEAMLDPSKKP